MSITGEAIGAAIGTIIFWAGFCGLTLLVCAAASIGQRIRRRRRGLELEHHLSSLDWPEL